MAERLKGKRAFVTAAGAGIGRAIARLFAQEGGDVLATDLDEVSLRALAREVQLHTAKLDVTDRSAVGRLLIGRQFDVVVNAAGRVDHGTALTSTEEDWDRAFDLNVKAMHRVIAAVLPGMVAQRSGSIINIGSVASSVKGVAQRYVYGSTKAAVIGLTKAVAVDFVSFGIRCNVICPGTISTPSLAARINGATDPATAMQGFLARQPMGRFGTPQEVAHLALYLASDESAFTSGAIHVVDGAWTA
jgi:2-keto-3-deoxy-L-fuconate dehydrogenase